MIAITTRSSMSVKPRAEETRQERRDNLAVAHLGKLGEGGASTDRDGLLRAYIFESTLEISKKN